MIRDVHWKSGNVLLENRILLFCFKEKCMSGKVSYFRQLGDFNEYEIEVGFIEPDFFQDELIPGNYFTVREASRILGEGKVKRVS